MQNERVQNTHGHWERVKIPLLPNNVGKKSANDAGPQQGHNSCKPFFSCPFTKKIALIVLCFFVENSRNGPRVLKQVANLSCLYYIFEK